MVGVSARDIRARGAFTITGAPVEVGLDAPRTGEVRIE
jgi:hypothetical protein